MKPFLFFTLFFQVPWCSTLLEPSGILDQTASLIPDSIPKLPDVAELSPLTSIEDFALEPVANTFNFAAVTQRAQAFYATLPETVLEDSKLLVPELIKKYGYPSESHKVTTLDGYILTMHRIPHGRNGAIKSGPVVYLQHGLLCSSADWVIAGPGKGLAYILADAGYDVWMPNARGNRYSRNHVSLDPDSIKFWDFSWHEIALFDVPAMMDYALNKTDQSQVYYIGHSQGTTVFYVLCSEKPEYNAKIKAQFSLAPIAYMSHMTSPLMQVVSKGQLGIDVTLRVLGVGEFLPNTGFVAQVGNILCKDDSVTQVLCTNALFAICGFNQKQMNSTLLPIITGHSPAGSSTRQLLHYAQEINSGRFCQYDRGIVTNKLRYGSLEPSRYFLNKISAPVYLIYSLNDWLSAERDVIRLYTELGNVKEKILVSDTKFNHIDYLFAINAPDVVYNVLLDRMKKQ